MVPLSPVYVVPFVLVVVGSPFLTIGMVTQRKNAAVRRWPRVPGRIVSAAVGTARPTGNWIDVRYTYEFGGQTYEGTKTSREGIGGTPDEMQAWLHRHPPGVQVSVYVDPHAPTTAYLAWARSVGAIILLVWGGVFVFAGLLVLAIFLLVGG